MIEFTPTEWEIIEHRLEVPDAIFDALEYSWDEQLQRSLPSEVTKDEVDEACGKLIASKGTIDWQMTTVEREVLMDACDGSVYLAIAADEVGGEINKGKYLALCKAANSIETKLPVTIPRS